MNQTIEPIRALQLLQRSFREHVSHLRAVEQRIMVMPRQPENQIKYVAEDSNETDLAFRVNPVVYRVHEKVGPGAPNLFVVVEGTLQISRALDQGRLMTTGFGTHVAYFRHKPTVSTLQHHFGMHYDFDSQSDNHPAFHAQFKPFANLESEVNAEFKLGATGDEGATISNVMRNIRIPTAQMDVFSVVLQICADHAMGEKKELGPQQLAAFHKLLACCDVLVGAAHMLTRFNPIEPSCYRGQHWYLEPQMSS